MNRNYLHIVKKFANSAQFCSAPSNVGTKFKKRIFSGIQPTGSLHIGNYFGAVRRWKELQEQGEDVIFSVVDLHSITMKQDPQELSKNIQTCTASLLACGIDPEKSILFQQSMVSRHAELSWVLGCLTTMPRLGHLPQYKEKSAKMKEIPLGLYIYPVLQSADILLYKATHVPVGEDQVQHIQLAQHLVNTFNARFGETFPPVKAVIEDSGVARLRSLRNPEKKMSKSDTDPKSRINLVDDPKQILEKCKKAVTDFQSEVTYEPEARRGVATLIDLVSLCTNKTPDQVCRENSDVDTGKFKLRVADILIEHLNPVRNEYNKLLQDPGYIQQVLNSGAERALGIAENTWTEVKKKVGLTSP